MFFSASEMAEHRADAESRMNSRCESRRIDPANPTTDPDTGFEVPGWAIQHADLPCFVASGGAGSGTRKITVSGAEIQVALRSLKVPALTTNIRDGDVFYVKSGETIGHYFTVLEGTPADHKKQRDLAAYEVPKPGGWL